MKRKVILLMPELTLITKNKCGLCEEMKEEIKKALADNVYTFDEKFIENDINLYKKYSEKVPVLLINGRIFAKFRVDREKLRKIIGFVL